ncbi:hypothetical protein VJI77_03370 [Parvimonas sp. D2]|uniref:DUF6994 family protein n=1 Tax=unclassified Parvimonas TaxID=1151464 RepID=UPI002B49E507|nr:MULTISPECIES: hypothetical protein [unclassified Parvimonas]MEB3012033.1 hypothetical protein [Parvimonas sp. D2]MEB3087534.1 hypothetical protein [Parvimonas sp. D4]
MIFYKDIYEYNIFIMKDIIKKYGTNEYAWRLFKSFYKDPDGFCINEKGFEYKNGIKCTADAVLSINRIYEHEGFNSEFVETFITYRKTSILFFPSERKGINTSRYRVFGDRIDYTLFDLKQFFENKECKLKSAYELPKTKKWLESFKNFGEMIEYFQIKGIFTDEDNNIFDLKKNNGDIINDYCNSYNKHWEEIYYKNVKEKINIFLKNVNNKLTTIK